MDIESNIQVIDRMVSLLNSLTHHTPASLKFLAADTDLHPSTAHRILAALQQHDWVQRDKQGGYELGSGLKRYVKPSAQQMDLREAALPIMAELRDQTGETINLTLREHDEVIYIERALSQRMMRVEQVIGSRAPLHVTAVGKLMLGEDGIPACLDYAQRTQLPAYTDNTITQVDRLCAESVSAHELAYALDNEEAEVGVGCIAVLIRDASGQAVAGLSISAPRERRKDEWVQSVMAAGQAISKRLGYVRGVVI